MLKIVKKLVTIIAVISCIPANTSIPPIKGLYNILNQDHIGLGQSLLYSGWLENIYQYKPGNPKEITKGKDSLVNLIRTFWFQRNEHDHFLPTELGVTTVLRQKLFGKLMGLIYSEQILDKKTKATFTQEWLDAYEHKMNNLRTIKDKLESHYTNIKKELLMYQNEMRDINKSIKKIKGKLRKLKRKKSADLKSTIDALEQEIKNKEKLATIEKEGIKSDIQKLEIQLINLGKKLKKAKDYIYKQENYVKQQFGTLQDQITFIINAINALITKDIIYPLMEGDLEYNYNKQKLFKKTSRKDCLDLILQAMGHTPSSLRNSGLRTQQDHLGIEDKEYPTGIIHAVLWAFFEQTCTDAQDLQLCLQEIANFTKGSKYKVFNKKYESKIFDESFYTQENFYPHGAYKILPTIILGKKDNTNSEKVSKILKNYDIALHSTIKQKIFNNFPPKIPQGYCTYKYEKNKETEEFPTCFESSLLDIVSILLYNPKTRKYDLNMLPDKAKRGEGVLQLLKVLQDPSNINNIIDQWIKIVSGLETIEYAQNTSTNKGYEIEPTMQNVINILNYIFSIHAQKIEDFSSLLSTNQRAISFILDDKNKKTNIAIIKIKYDTHKLKLIIKPGHAYVEFKERENQNNKDYTPYLRHAIITQATFGDNKLLPFFPILANNEILCERNCHQIGIEIFDFVTTSLNLIPSYTIFKQTMATKNIAYYSLNLKDNETKLNFIKYALSHNILKDKSLQHLVYKLINSLSNDIYYKENICRSILWHKAHLQYKYLFTYLTEKEPSATVNTILGEYVLQNKVAKNILRFLIQNNKINFDLLDNEKKLIFIEQALKCNCLKDMYIRGIVYKYIKSMPNKKEICTYILKYKRYLYPGLKRYILEENPGVTLLTICSLHYNSFLKENIKEKEALKLLLHLLDEKKIDIHTRDNSGNTPLHLAVQNSNQQIITALLKHKDLNINARNNLGNTALHIAIRQASNDLSSGLKEIIEILLTHKNINLHIKNNNQQTPLEIAKQGEFRRPHYYFNFIKNIKRRQEIIQLLESHETQ